VPFCDLIFNCNEIGVSEWEDRKSKKVVIPMDMEDYLIRHKVRKNINHLTVLTCAAAGENALCPVTVTSRKVPDDSSQCGHRPGKDFLIERSAKSYLDHAIFEPFIHHHLIPHITAPTTIPKLKLCC
jgi:hypothetical protein